jgi:hypothetical protein
LITHDSLSESLAYMQHQEAQPKPCVRPPAGPGVDVGEWHELLEAYRKIGPTARKVLLMKAKRLAVGRVQYNDDFTDQSRDMLKDALEEAIDLSTYLEVELTRLMDR